MLHSLGVGIQSRSLPEIVGLPRVSGEHSFELANDWPGILSFPIGGRPFRPC